MNLASTNKQKDSLENFSPPLKAAVRDGQAYAIMAGAGEGYLNAFSIFLKSSPVVLGIQSSLPPFIGAIGQLIGLWLLQFGGSRRTLIYKSVILNGLVWLPIGLIPFVLGSTEAASAALVALTCIYYMSGGLSGPAWNSLIGDMVPESIRGQYFGVRSRSIGLFSFLAMIGAGQALDLFKHISDVAVGFLFIFLVSLVSRLVSAYWLTKYEDPQHDTINPRNYFSFWQFLLATPRSNFARFTLYISLMNAATLMSGPFFTLYMLRDLSFSYSQLTIAQGMSIVSQFLTMQYWGRLLDVFGCKKILEVTAIGVVIAPFLWLGYPSIWYVLGIQIFNGFVWAGFNLASTTFIFDAVSPAKRARCTAYQATVQGTLVLITATAGGIIVQHLPSSVTLMNLTWHPYSPLYLLFIISGLLRGVSSLVLLPRFNEVKEVKQIKHTDLIFKIATFRPISGVTFSIFSESRKRKSNR